jgi:hypothetical protein
MGFVRHQQFLTNPPPSPGSAPLSIRHVPIVPVSSPDFAWHGIPPVSFFAVISRYVLCGGDGAGGLAYGRFPRFQCAKHMPWVVSIIACVFTFLAHTFVIIMNMPLPSLGLEHVGHDVTVMEVIGAVRNDCFLIQAAPSGTDGASTK